MPELPEVETARRGIAPLVEGRRVVAVTVRQPRLRWPVSARLCRELPGQRIETVARRAKWLLFATGSGTLLAHLGMSGSLRVVPAGSPPGRHDHADLQFDDGNCLRLCDPRRFGALLWTTRDPLRHRLLRDLGPEPLAAGFDGAYLQQQSRGRRIAIKPFLMDNRVIVGVGNIYASEALHRAGVDPRRAVGRVAAARFDRVAEAIVEVLAEAIEAGGTTLRDFQDAHGQPGYFRIRLAVYGRAGAPCLVCGQPVRQCRQGQRSSYYCGNCQH